MLQNSENLSIEIIYKSAGIYVAEDLSIFAPYIGWN